MAEKLVLVSALDQLQKGDEFVKWPLHVTMVPWFAVPEGKRAAFGNALANRVHGMRTIRVKGGDDVFFGDNEKSVRVRKLHSSGALHSLHKQLLETIEYFEGEVNSPYIADDYVPHVTYQDIGGIDEGQEIALKALHLIRADVSGLRVVERVFYYQSGKND